MPFFYKPYKNVQCSLQDRENERFKSNAQAMIKKYGIFKQSVVIREAICKKRALRFAPLPALMTVEAAIVLPLFLIAVLTLANVFHMLGVCQEMITAAARSTHAASVHGHDENFGTDQLMSGLVLGLGGSDVDFSQISGGMAGIDYWGTDYDGESGEISVQLSCRLLPALRVFNIGTVPLTVSMRSRAFIGGKMLNESSDKKPSQGPVVFVAENGVVYHTSRTCAYIDLSLHGVYASSVESMRNSQGGKYYPCELCGSTGGSAVVYLTDTGNRYHCSSQCSGIRRSVYEMILTPDCVLPPCSRCAGG